MTQFIYQTDFYLMADVIDYDDAKAYLEEENMLQYFDNEQIKRKLKSIYWRLDNEGAGRVVVTANQELEDYELEELSDYILGQNSDGLGEGFEQQEFAEYDAAKWADGEYNEYAEYEDGYEEDWVVASFDWKYNKYPLELIAVE